jgi:hypothetical protein
MVTNVFGRQWTMGMCEMVTEKKFDCHLTHPHYWMVTKTFLSPQDGGVSYVFG